MPKAHCASCDLAFKLKMEAEALVDNLEIAVDKEINLIYFCHIVLPVCLAMCGNEHF